MHLADRGKEQEKGIDLVLMEKKVEGAGMRRKDRELTKEEAMEILSNGEFGVLSTVSEDGQPYGVPVSYAYKDGFVYVHCSCEGGLKIDNLRCNSRASFTVVGSTELQPESFGTRYASAIAFGTVEILESREDKREGIEAIMYRYSSEFEEAGIKYINAAIDKIYILKFRVNEITGKSKR